MRFIVLNSAQFGRRSQTSTFGFICYCQFRVLFGPSQVEFEELGIASLGGVSGESGNANILIPF